MSMICRSRRVSEAWSDVGICYVSSIPATKIANRAGRLEGPGHGGPGAAPVPPALLWPDVPACVQRFGGKGEANDDTQTSGSQRVDRLTPARFDSRARTAAGGAGAGTRPGPAPGRRGGGAPDAPVVL